MIHRLTNVTQPDGLTSSFNVHISEIIPTEDGVPMQDSQLGRADLIGSIKGTGSLETALQSYDHITRSDYISYGVTPRNGRAKYACDCLHVRHQVLDDGNCHIRLSSGGGVPILNSSTWKDQSPEIRSAFLLRAFSHIVAGQSPPYTYRFGLFKRDGWEDLLGVLRLTADAKVVLPITGVLSSYFEPRTLDMRRFPHHEKNLQTVMVPLPKYLDSDIYNQKIDALIQESLSSVAPVWDTGFSLPLFLFELIELKSLFKSVISIVSELPQFVRSLFNQPLKELGKKNLEANFGWIPLVSDLEYILTKFITFRADFDQLQENAGKVLTHRFRKNLHPETFQDASFFAPESIFAGNRNVTFWGEWPNDYSVSFYTTLVRSREVRNLRFQSTVKYTYQIPNYGRLARIYALMDRYGLNIDLSDVWNAIPFSFIIDWIYDVGSLLEEATGSSDFSPSVVIHDHCYSLKYEYYDSIKVTGIDNFSERLPTEATSEPFSLPEFETDALLTVVNNNDQWSVGPPEKGIFKPYSPFGSPAPVLGAPIITDPLPVCTVKQSVYLRRRVSPELQLKALWPSFRLPNGKRLGLLASLIAARGVSTSHRYWE